MKQLQQNAAATHRKGRRQDYEAAIKHIYNLLREAWERSVEEVLLNGVVERYRRSVETQRARSLADITTEDCEQLENGMERASSFLHDQAPADVSPIPGPDAVMADIGALETWVKRITRRR